MALLCSLLTPDSPKLWTATIQYGVESKINSTASGIETSDNFEVRLGGDGSCGRTPCMPVRPGNGPANLETSGFASFPCGRVRQKWAVTGSPILPQSRRASLTTMSEPMETSDRFCSLGVQKPANAAAITGAAAAEPLAGEPAHCPMISLRPYWSPCRTARS